MNTKCAFLVVSVVLLAAFAGVAVMGDAYAEGDGAADSGSETSETPTEPTVTATVVYHIGTTVVNDTVTGTGAAIPTTLKDLATLGYSIPAGKTFHGWSTSEIVEGTAPTNVYSAGSTYSVGVVTGANLYAYITADVYTVSFTYEDGTVISSDKTKSYGQTVALPVVSETKGAGKVIEFVDGQCFVGWALKNTTEVVIASDAAEATVTGNAAYVAVYAHNPVLTFIVDGTTTYSHTVYGIVLPSAPTKEGFTFLGWSDGTEVISDLSAFAESVAADTTLVAVWEPAVYTAHFYADGEEILPAQSVKHGELVTEPKTIPVKEGYDFVAWDHDFSAPVTSDLDIQAVFEPTPAPAPTGFDDPTTQVLAICLGTLVLAMIALAVWKREAIRVEMLKRLDKGKKGPGDGQA